MPYRTLWGYMVDNETPPRAFGDLIPLPEGLRVVVVLVEPKDPRNIGSVARVMSNLGITELRLVTPANFDLTLARGVACWGADIINSSTSYGDLKEALADAHEVLGFASDSAMHRVPQLLLDEWIERLAKAPTKTVALVFGSEESGLRREHYPLCQFLVRIPSSAANPSYNLAQSVLIALYSLTKRLGSAVGAERGEWCTSTQLEGFTEMVVSTAKEVGFLNDHSPNHMSDLLANLSRRGHLSNRELTILTGLFGQIRKELIRRGKTEM